MSSIVKAVEGVMRLFPKKINVTFKHVAGHTLGVIKMYEEQLPEKFKRPVIIEAFGRSWRVLEAEPRENKDFVYTRKLELVVVEPELAGKFVKEYFTATVAGSLPEIVANSYYSDFGVNILEEEWRQVELLPAGYLTMVKEEIAVIERILRPGKGVSVLRGYESRYVREKIIPGIIGISLSEFCNVVESSKIGALRFGNKGFVKGGFLLESNGYTYYGIVQDKVITDLCLHKFDYADLELFTILSSFYLVMAHWCKGRIFTSELVEMNEDVSSLGFGQNDII